jgi:PAS domain-containing protein
MDGPPAALGALPVGIAIFDAAGAPLFRNAAFLRLAGGEPISPDALPGAARRVALPNGYGSLAVLDDGGEDVGRAAALEEVLLGLSAGVARFGPDMGLAFANPAYARLLGLPPESVRPGRPFLDLVRDQALAGQFGTVDPDAMVETARARDRSRPRQYERRRPDGAVLRFANAPLPDGGWLAEVADVTAEREAERETARRAALQQAVFDALPVGVAVYGPDRRVALVNPAYNAILSDSPIAPGEHVRDILRRRAAAGDLGEGDAEAQVEAILAGLHRPQRFESRRATGRTRIHRSVPLPDGGHAVLVTDETALQAAQAEARRRNALLTTMLESTRHGIALFDAEGVVIAANRLAETFCGLPEGSFAPGASIYELRRLQVESGVYGGAEEARRFLADRLTLPLRGPDRYVRPAPGGRMVEVVTDLLPDGAGFVRSFTDVTALAHAEEEARRRAALTETLLAHVRHALTLVGPDNRIVATNPVAVRLVGAPGPEAMVGRDFDEVLAEPAARDAFLARGRAVDRSRPARFQRDRPDGARLDIAYEPVPGGGYAVSVTDITALVQAEAEAARRAELQLALVSNAPHGLILYDRDLRLAACNALAAELTAIPDLAARAGITLRAVLEEQARRGLFRDDPGADGPDTLAWQLALDRSLPQRFVCRPPDGRVLQFWCDPLPGGGCVVAIADVTELDAARAEAERRAAVLATLVGNSRQGLLLYGPDHRLMAGNASGAAWSGLPPVEGLIGRHISELLVLQAQADEFGDPGAAAAAIAEILAFDRGRPRRVRRRRANGRIVEVASDPVPGGGFVVSYADVTELETARAEAERRAELLQGLVANSPQGLLLYDAAHRLVAGNALGAERGGIGELAGRLGRTLAELLDDQLRAGEFGPPDGDAARGHAARIAALDRRAPQRFQRVRPNGQVIDIASDPVPGGGFIVAYGDVTELETARAEAERRAAVLRATLDATQHGILLYGPDRRVIAANDKMAGLCGLPDGAGMRGMGFDEVLEAQLRHEGRWPGDVARLVAGYAALDRSNRIRYQRVTADGRTLDVASDPTEGGGFVITISDVTPLAEARQAAERQAATLRATLDAAPLSIALFGPDRRIVAANDLAAEMCGLPSGAAMAGLSWDEASVAMHRHEGRAAGEVGALLAPYAALDRSRRQRYQRRTAAGRVLESVSDPTPDGGFVVATNDVTPLVGAREEAERRAQVLRTTLEASRAAIALYGPDGRVVAANELMARHTKHASVAAMVGRHHADIMREHYAREFAGDPREAAERTRAVMALDRSRSHRYQRPGADGRVYDVASDPAPGGGFVVSISDVTALVAAEAAAEARAKTLSTMLDNIRHGICLFGADERIVAANPMLTRMMGLPAEVFAPGRTLAELVGSMLAHGEYGEGAAAEATARAILARDRSRSFRTTRTRRNGRVVDAVSDPTPDGGWVLTFTDVTEERAVRAELERARAAAEQASLAKSRFLATMSHELRTPLNAVIGFSEALRAGGMPRHAAEMAASIHEAGTHLLALIDDILDATRAEVGALPVLAEPTIPAAAAEAAARLLHSAAEQAGVAIAVRAPVELPQVLADPRRLHQILTNLVSNAIKFSPAGGTVTLSAAADAGGGLEFAVADRGIGIAPEDLERAFQPFTQLDSSPARRYGGSGLGLHLSRVLAEALGATLALDSAPGEGTIARLRFPPGRVVPTFQGTAPK